MDDLLDRQIRNSCRLALPDGLKELMCDISREVLRAQPQNLYDFIANYLSVLLVSREHLSIAHHLCNTVCETYCHKELEDELRFLGFDEGKIPDVREVIMEHFCNDEGGQAKLMKKLIEEFDMNEEQLNAVHNALHNAFKRHLVNKTTYYESSTESELDEVDLAAKHTLKIFRKTDVSNEQFTRAVDNVKASYRAFGVTRVPEHPNVNELKAEMEPEKESNKTGLDKLKNIKFYDNLSHISNEDHTKPEPFTTKKLSTVSSTTLAGSYVNLPKLVPYSVHESNLSPVHETGAEQQTRLSQDHETNAHQKTKARYETKISFQYPEVEDHADMADIETDSDVEEVTSLNSESSEREQTFGNYDHADFNEEIDQYVITD